MMDDLTPEERDALKNLPRERMPSAGLEDRVVGAMRDRGLLTAKQPGRVVRLTSSRVAGLLAACVVLIVGAYSIGLQRGDREQTIIGVQPPELRAIPYSEIEVQSQAEDAERSELADDDVATGNASTLAKQEPAANQAAPPESKPGVKLDLQTRSGRSDEGAGAADAGLAAEEMSGASREITSEAVETSPASAPEPAGEVMESAPARKKESRQQPPPTLKYSRDFAPQSLAPSTARLRTYQLGGSAFTVDAPDSVRIVESPDGREILIYTSDGLIRVRLAD
jgi:hypothetical protein